MSSAVERAFCESRSWCGIQWLLSLDRFTVYPRPRTIRREQPAFKVKSILKGTEYEGRSSYAVRYLIFNPTCPVTSQYPAKN
jgi:hypothetical protein